MSYRRRQSPSPSPACPIVVRDGGGGEAFIAPATFTDRFSAYLAALRDAGARYAPELRGSLLPIASVPDLVRGLVGPGFDPRLSARVARRLRELAGDVSPRPVAAPPPPLPAEDPGPDLGPLTETLFPFQRQAVRWLRSTPRRLLSLPMGAGKTIAALAALPAEPRVLVVCPASVKAVWRDEAARWRPDLSPVVLSGRGSFRWPEPGELVILNPELLPDPTARPGAPERVSVVADECHLFKNPSAKRSGRFRALVGEALAAGGTAWGLTGTPIMSRLDDLAGVLEALHLAGDVWEDDDHRAELFDEHPAFVNARGRLIEDGTTSGDPDPELSVRLQRVMLRRSRAEILGHLPPKRRQTVPVEIPTAAIRAADELLAAFEAAGVDLEDVADVLADADRTGIPRELVSAARNALALAKADAALRLVREYEDAEEPLLVFSAHRGPVEALGRRAGWGLIVGDIPQPKRAQLVRDFQEGRLRGLAATIQAAGVGLTLTRAAHVLFVDRSWTPAENDQAEDRAYRIGQTRGVLVLDLVADHPLDTKVHEILTRKRRLIAATVDAAARIR